MIRYFENIPSAAVFRHFDGNLYANVVYRIAESPLGTIQVREGEPRMVQVDARSKTQNGVTSVYIGRAGNAIAQTVNLPFAVTYEKVQPWPTFANCA